MVENAEWKGKVTAIKAAALNEKVDKIMIQLVRNSMFRKEFIENPKEFAEELKIEFPSGVLERVVEAIKDFDAKIPKLKAGKGSCAWCIWNH